LDRTARRLHQNKANKAQVLSSFPANSSGKDGDIVFVKKGTGLSQAVKSGGRWIMIGSGTPLDTARKTVKPQPQTVIVRGSGGGSMEGAVLRNGSTPFEAVQSGVTPTESDHLATKSYVDSIDSGKLTSVIDAAATPGTGGQHGNLPSGHVCLIEDGGASQDKATLYNVASANSNLLIEDDEDGSGNAFIKFTAQDQSVSLHRFDTIYHYDDTDAWINTSTASGAQGVAFVDTETVTFTTVDQAGSGTYVNKVKVSAVAANDNTTYSTNASSVTGGANFNLVGANPTSTDALKFAGGGTTTVTRTDASTITISSTDANDNYYLNGITKNGNTLTFAVNGATNQPYTFGSNAFNSTAFLTSISSTLATDESASPARVSILDDGSTVKALEEGTGISIEESATAGGDTVKISSTVNTSGMLTNGIVTIEDSSDDTQNASGGDILKFAEDSTSTISWDVTMSTNTITITPSLSGYNNGNWNTAYTHSQATHAPTNAEQNVQSDWNAGSGDAHILNKPAIPTRDSLGIDTDDTVRFGNVEVDNDLWINGYADSTASRIRFHHNGSNAYQDWETGAYYMRYDTDTRFMYDSSGNFHADADVYAYSTSVGSDKKLKKNIKDIKYGLSDVLKLRGVDFDWKEKRDGRHDIGVIAQEVQEVVPEVVREVDDFEGGTYLAVDYSKLVPVLIESIKELKKELDGIRKSR
jgi:hypothetical protein